MLEVLFAILCFNLSGFFLQRFIFILQKQIFKRVRRDFMFYSYIFLCILNTIIYLNISFWFLSEAIN